MPDTDLVLDPTAEPSSARIADGSESLCYRLVTGKDDVYTAAIQVLNILEVATLIATYLLPGKLRQPEELLEPEDEVLTHGSLLSFSGVCPMLYCSGMRVLYRHVGWLPNLWYTIADTTGKLQYPQIQTLVEDLELLLFALDLQYNKEDVHDRPESVVAYKFRRFLFVTAQVRELKIDNSHFSNEVFEFISRLLPKTRSLLFPGLRTISWTDNKYLLPSFLCSDDNDNSQSSYCVHPLPFDPAGIRSIELQIHNFMSPIRATAHQQFFYASLHNLRSQCREVFPFLDELMFTISWHHYTLPGPLPQAVLDEITTLLLGSGAVALSTDISRPPPTLPFPKECLLNGGLRESLVVNGYIAHTPARNALGSAPPSDAFPTISAHLVGSPTLLAISCTTNMTAPALTERHTILRMLAPAMRFLCLETVILHLDTVFLRLSHADLAAFGDAWKNLLNLDLRFKTIVTNQQTDIVQIPSVQMMSRPEFAGSLKRLHLPELDVRNFRNIMNYRHDTLISLSSNVLHFNDHEVMEVSAALLGAFPNLTTVVGPGSAPEWARFISILSLTLPADAIGGPVERLASNPQGGGCGSYPALSPFTGHLVILPHILYTFSTLGPSAPAGFMIVVV
ncbi:hypothetical protein LXA43DRAFT_1069134 [Ganoderma leucocontextum]|nr:hypothetical protein LXA43DRAFT_1069134 [Ganoderma leucocontextum]